MYELLSIVVNRILIRKRGGDTGRARGRRQQAGSVGSMGGIAIAYRRLGLRHDPDASAMASRLVFSRCYK